MVAGRVLAEQTTSPYSKEYGNVYVHESTKIICISIHLRVVDKTMVIDNKDDILSIDYFLNLFSMKCV